MREQSDSTCVCVCVCVCACFVYNRRCHIQEMMTKMKKDKDSTNGAARSTVNMEYITYKEKNSHMIDRL